MLLIILWINTMFGRTNPKQKISSPGFKRFKRKQKQKYRQPTIPLQMEHRASLSIGVCSLHLVWEPHVQKPETLLSSSGGCKSICCTVAGSSLDSQLAEKIVCCGPSMATVHWHLPISQGRPGPTGTSEMLQSQPTWPEVLWRGYAFLPGSVTQFLSFGWALARKLPSPHEVMGNVCPYVSPFTFWELAPPISYCGCCVVPGEAFL